MTTQSESYGQQLPGENRKIASQFFLIQIFFGNWPIWNEKKKKKIKDFCIQIKYRPVTKQTPPPPKKKVVFHRSASIYVYYFNYYLYIILFFWVRRWRSEFHFWSTTWQTHDNFGQWGRRRRKNWLQWFCFFHVSQDR